MTTAERYFNFLETQYVAEDGSRRQPATGNFVQCLREAHAEQAPRFDISACLTGTQPNFAGRIWCWSDLHFFHTNIIKYCGRPFATAQKMNDALLKNCLACVGPDDILLIGGDITMSNLDGTNALLRAIPGYKINVLGNHDTHKHQRLKLAVDETVACLELAYQGRSIFVSHYPVSESVLAPGQVNLHGHIHNNGLPPALGDGSRHINMCVELTGYSPVPLETLLAECHSGENREGPSVTQLKAAVAAGIADSRAGRFTEFSSKEALSAHLEKMRELEKSGLIQVLLNATGREPVDLPRDKRKEGDI